MDAIPARRVRRGDVFSRRMGAFGRFMEIVEFVLVFWTTLSGFWPS
jgi:hypothetical protein